jgi:hypothetical protein
MPNLRWQKDVRIKGLSRTAEGCLHLHGRDVEFDLLVDGYGDVIVYPSVIPKRPA